MQNTLVTVSMLAVLIGGTQFLSAQPKGERATINGEVVDLWCYWNILFLTGAPLRNS